MLRLDDPLQDVVVIKQQVRDHQEQTHSWEIASTARQQTWLCSGDPEVICTDKDMLTQSKFLIGKCSSSLSPKPPKTWSVMMILLAIIHKTQAVSCHLTLWIAQGHQQGSKDPATTLASGE